MHTQGDRNDPEYLKEFYGQNAVKLSLIKRKYDPLSVFYCPTCIGSELWKVQGNGKICPKK